MISDEKLKALDAALANIEKQFGKGSVRIFILMYRPFLQVP